jgi:hypothetical protein
LDEPAELINYRDENPDFPHDPTLDQFYDERRFESYRALGWHIGHKVTDAIEQERLAIGDGKLCGDGLPDSVIHRLVRHLDAPSNVRGELLMGLKEALFDRQLNREPLTESERQAIIRFVLNGSSTDQREPWEEAVLFACIIDLLAESPEISETAINRALQNSELREFASRLLQSLKKREAPTKPPQASI